MNPRFLLAGVLVIVLVALAGFGLARMTGFFVLGGENPEVQVKIDDGKNVLTYSVVITPRESALDALVRVAVVDYRTEGALGAKVTEINGVKTDNEHSWLYLVNDEMPDTACSHYHPSDGDVITFRYMILEEIGEYFK